MKVKNENEILEDCLIAGLNYGVMRLFKHRETDSITEDELNNAIDDLVNHCMNEIYERFSFEDFTHDRQFELFKMFAASGMFHSYEAASNAALNALNSFNESLDAK